MNTSELYQAIVSNTEQIRSACQTADWPALATAERQLARLLDSLPARPARQADQASLENALQRARDELDAARQRTQEWQRDMEPLLAALGKPQATDSA